MTADETQFTTLLYCVELSLALSLFACLRSACGLRLFSFRLCLVDRLHNVLFCVCVCVCVCLRQGRSIFEIRLLTSNCTHSAPRIFFFFYYLAPLSRLLLCVVRRSTGLFLLYFFFRFLFLLNLCFVGLLSSLLICLAVVCQQILAWLRLWRSPRGCLTATVCLVDPDCPRMKMRPPHLQPSLQILRVT